MASARWYPELDGFEPRRVAVLDTDTGTLRPITYEWMADFDRKSSDFDSGLNVSIRSGLEITTCFDR